MTKEDETKALFEAGLKVRREVLGADYVDTSIANANDFTMAFQHITTEWCWGMAGTAPAPPQDAQHAQSCHAHRTQSRA